MVTMVSMNFALKVRTLIRLDAVRFRLLQFECITVYALMSTNPWLVIMLYESNAKQGHPQAIGIVRSYPVFSQSRILQATRVHQLPWDPHSTTLAHIDKLLALCRVAVMSM